MSLILHRYKIYCYSVIFQSTGEKWNSLGPVADIV